MPETSSSAHFPFISHLRFAGAEHATLRSKSPCRKKSAARNSRQTSSVRSPASLRNSSSVSPTHPMTRRLYLVFYDVSDPRTLKKARALVSAYSVSNQKSFFECWMTKAEVQNLASSFTALIDPKTDRVHILQLEDRLLKLLVGRARRSDPQPFMVL